MNPDLLNNLYLVGGLLVAISMIVRRFTSVSQKSIQHSVDSLQLQIKSLQLQIKEQADRMESGFTKLEDRFGKVENRLGTVESRLGKVENRLGIVENRLGTVESRLGKGEAGLVVVDDRVRDLQMDMAVVKDRLNILTDDRPASPVPVRAGAPAPKAVAAEA